MGLGSLGYAAGRGQARRLRAFASGSLDGIGQDFCPVCPPTFCPPFIEPAQQCPTFACPPSFCPTLDTTGFCPPAFDPSLVPPTEPTPANVPPGVPSSATPQVDSAGNIVGYYQTSADGTSTTQWDANGNLLSTTPSTTDPATGLSIPRIPPFPSAGGGGGGSPVSPAVVGQTATLANSLVQALASGRVTRYPNGQIGWTVGGRTMASTQLSNGTYRLPNGAVVSPTGQILGYGAPATGLSGALSSLTSSPMLLLGIGVVVLLMLGRR